MDQTLANINSLYTEVEKGVAMMWLDDGHVTFALGRGVHEIHVDLAREGPTCGLLPVGKAVERVSTSGLEWNLDEGEMAFGGLISSSNAFKESVVRVSTSDTILWTHEVRLG